MQQNNSIERILYLVLFLRRSNQQITTNNILQMASSVNCPLEQLQVDLVVNVLSNSSESIEELIQRARTTSVSVTAIPQAVSEPVAQAAAVQEETIEDETDLGEGLDALFR